MSAVDPEYCFRSIDVGGYSRESDFTMFRECLKNLIPNSQILPNPIRLYNTTESPQPFVFVANEAFGLHKNMLRHFAGRDLTQKSVFLITGY